MLDFVILGAQKAGSTYIQQQLAAHPRLYSPYGETPFFQDPDYREAGEQAGYERLVADLRRAAGGRKIGIKRPNYFPAPEVPARVKRHAPDARLMVVLRDPRERIVSAYYHLMRHITLPVAPLEIGLRRLLDGDIDEQRWPIAQSVLTFGAYGQHLRQWLQCFPPDQLLVLFLQDIKKDPTETLRRCFVHLGVEVRPPQVFPKRPMEGIYSLPRQRWNHAASRLIYEYTDGRRRIKNRRNPLVRGAGLALRAADKLLLAKLFPAKPPKLPDDLRRQLTDYYAADVGLLEELTGRDLADWRN